MRDEMNRRQAMDLMAMAMLATSRSSVNATDFLPAVVQSHDESLQRAIDKQVTDPSSRWCGTVPDRWGLFHCGSAARILRDGAAALFCEKSKFHASKDLYRRMKLAAEGAEARTEPASESEETSDSDPAPDSEASNEASDDGEKHE